MKSLYIGIAALLLLLMVAVGGSAAYFFSSVSAQKEHAKTDQYIEIEKGTAPNAVLERLQNEGIISSSFLAKTYLRFFGDSSKIQAGDYKFKSPISIVEVIDELESGKLRTKRITIPEGWTRFEIAKRLSSKLSSEKPMTEKDVMALLDDTSLIKDIDPQAKNLEGYLYPTTYELELDATPADAVKRMVEQFRKTWKPEYTLDAQKLNLSNREVMTIASLIENETKVESERRIVSSVIHNRLRKGMALGIDATNVYIAKLRGKWDGILHKSDLEIAHPYNTRKISGLPPGPISSASESAIKAALNPDTTDYLFYVLNVDKDDGSHNFYASAAEFEKGKAKYQRWLAEQRKKQ